MLQKNFIKSIFTVLAISICVLFEYLWYAKNKNKKSEIKFRSTNQIFAKISKDRSQIFNIGSISGEILKNRNGIRFSRSPVSEDPDP